MTALPRFAGRIGGRLHDARHRIHPAGARLRAGLRRACHRPPQGASAAARGQGHRGDAGAGPQGDLDEWVELAYDDTPQRMWPVAKRSLLAHVQRYRGAGAASAGMSEPVRLAKRVAAMVPCSRREAELYIEGGWVRVDGVVVEEPQHRVSEDELVELDPGATLAALEPVTLLLHKPGNVSADAALAASGAHCARSRRSLGHPQRQASLRATDAAAAVAGSGQRPDRVQPGPAHRAQAHRGRSDHRAGVGGAKSRARYAPTDWRCSAMAWPSKASRCRRSR